jgi:predicted nucleic acid-binding protein
MPNFFDASALVKRYLNEPKSEAVKKFWDNSTTKYTSTFCYYEALSILKGKRKLQIDPLSQAEYLKAAFDLTAWYCASKQRIIELDFTDRETYDLVNKLSEKTGLDLSDAFQIVCIKSGCFSKLIGNSSPLLITADRELGDVARSEGVRVWKVLDEDAPFAL